MSTRMLCSVLDEMRTCYETRNFSYFLGLVEEAQVLGNRMEAGLDEKHNAEYYREQRKVAQKELKKLEDKIQALKDENPEIDEE